MKKITFLSAILILYSISSFSQTKRIAFRSHGGKAHEFSMNEEGNCGIPYYNYPSKEDKEAAKKDSIAKAKEAAIAKAKWDSIGKEIVKMGAKIKADSIAKLNSKKPIPAPIVLKPEALAEVKKHASNNAVQLEINSIKVFPNPFADQTNISFNLEKSQQVNSSIFDLKGKLIAVLCNSKLGEGSYLFSWNAVNTAQGVYVVRTVIDGKTYTSKIVKK